MKFFLIDLSKRNPFHAVKDSASILQVLEIFEKTGTHRVALVKDNGDIVNVITQSAIVSFFESYITQLGPAARKTLHFHFPLDKELISIKSSDQAIDAFKLMDKKRVNAVAVLNSDGTLYSVISAKDIKVLEQKGEKVLFNRLYLSGQEFCDLAHKDSGSTIVGGKPLQTLADVITKLSALKKHRLFVLGDDKKPLGVISLGDVCNSILKIAREEAKEN